MALKKLKDSANNKPESVEMMNENEREHLDREEEKEELETAYNEVLDKGLDLIKDMFNLDDRFNLLSFTDDSKKGVILTVDNIDYKITVTVKNPYRVGIKRADEDY